MDVTAILLMLRNGWNATERHEQSSETAGPAPHQRLAQRLDEVAQHLQRLAESDPRRKIFALLKEVVAEDHWDGIFAATSRLLSRAVEEEAVSEAAFLRYRDESFYEPFRGQSLSVLQTQLRSIAPGIKCFSHPWFCLWHAALHSLLEESTEESLYTAQIIGTELINSCSRSLATYDAGQLNFDVAKSFWLRGRAIQSLAAILRSFAEKEEFFRWAKEDMQESMAISGKAVLEVEDDPLPNSARRWQMECSEQLRRLPAEQYWSHNAPS